MEIVVVGGGASGLIAAIEAAGRGRVTVIERCARVGRKLAVTGNGRCNLTNLRLTAKNYHGEDRDFPRPALEAFPARDTLAFFRKLGLVTVAEPSGRVYPHSDQAGSVVDVLRFAALERGVDVLCGVCVREIRREGQGFRVICEDRELTCRYVIVAAGGAAGVRAGGSDLGYRLLEGLGHTRTAIYPSLVQLKTENAFTRPLKGVRAQASVEVISRGAVAAASRGEVQFTDFGVSGPAIFEISRAAVTAPEPLLRLDLMPSLTGEELLEILLSRRETGLNGEDLLTGILHNKLGRTVVTHLGLPLNRPLSQMSRRDMERVAQAVKRTELRVTGNLGMEGAQVTAGGIRTGEFDPRTLESRLVPGLFACGEVLDVDGDCGGYNLQWAWASGRLAGRLGARSQENQENGEGDGV